MRELDIKEIKSCPQTKSNDKFLHMEVSKLVTWVFFLCCIAWFVFSVELSTGILHSDLSGHVFYHWHEENRFLPVETPFVLKIIYY